MLKPGRFLLPPIVSTCNLAQRSLRNICGRSGEKIAYSFVVNVIRKSSVATPTTLDCISQATCTFRKEARTQISPQPRGHSCFVTFDDFIMGISAFIDRIIAAAIFFNGFPLVRYQERPKYSGRDGNNRDYLLNAKWKASLEMLYVLYVLYFIPCLYACAGIPFLIMITINIC